MKNILIFSDGTGQAGGLKPDQRLSNIYKLYRAMRVGPENAVDPTKQLAFYDAGLGTDPDVGSGSISWLQWLRGVANSAFGSGLMRNVMDCYTAILTYYEPGDRIYLFGFSRGAYTIRCVAGVLSLCGVPVQDAAGRPLVRTRSSIRKIAAEAVRKVYEHGAGRNRRQYMAERSELARRFRATYGTDRAGTSNVNPYFIGAFDTVAALGATGTAAWLLRGALLLAYLGTSALLAWPLTRILDTTYPASVGVVALIAALLWLTMALRRGLRWIRDFDGSFLRMHVIGWRGQHYDKDLDADVKFVRHALAIDENRGAFARVGWGFKGSESTSAAGEPERMIQLWFPGNHSDIGGSYPENESRLSDIALQWMVEELEAVPHPPLIDHSKLQLYPSAGGAQHCELARLEDRIPRWLRPVFKGWRRAPRKEARGAPCHPSVAERFALPAVMQAGVFAAYRPEVLREDPTYAKYYEI